MSHLTHGGRIVPILTGHQQHPESTVAEMVAVRNKPLEDILLLQDQQEDASAAKTRQSKALDRESLEMPCLKARGLFALPTEGDGNCLYYSLSDQLYGNFDHADEFRNLLADHMASRKSYFMQFVVAEGGERRRPKRAAASVKYSMRSAAVPPPSQEDKERRFEDMVAATRKNGEWGSSEHLQAFCQVFKVDINVYTMEGLQRFRDVSASADKPRDVVHVAFHDFKHYSSVRSIVGKHEGLFTKSKHVEPSKTVNAALPKKLAAPDDKTLATDGRSRPKDAGLAVDVDPPWDIKSIQEVLGGRYDRETIVQMLQKCRGDIDRAFAALLDEKNDLPAEKKISSGLILKPSLQASRSSSPFSTGSKRSAEDSDDSEDPRPATQRVRPKRRIVSNLTVGVGISFRDDHNELVSLNLRVSSPKPGSADEKTVADTSDQMKANSENGQNSESASSDADQEQSDAVSQKGPRRSGRLSRPKAIGS